MNLSDILNLFRQGKGTARSHMKNLIEMAVVDGNFDLIEYDLLKKIAKRNNISERDLNAIREAPHNIAFELPIDKHQRFYQFYDLVRMMTIDNSVHNDEIELCSLFGLKFGYPRPTIKAIITNIQSNIKFGVDHEETYKVVEHLIEPTPKGV